MNKNICMGSEISDHGAEPLAANIEQVTKANLTYRTAFWTGNQLQVTVMSIPVGGDIGLEMHPHTEQFIRIENGCALAVMGKRKDFLNIRKKINNSYAVIIPAGTWHNIINIGNTPLKLYSIYAPVQHPFGTVHETKKVAEL
ncbi:MAG: cupin domain-containing protein, partial [Oscillospiraceae bacterium]